MTKHYNRKQEKDKRRQLRKDQTYCEQIMWLHLRNRKLLGIKFKRQYSVDKYVIDFYAPEMKLAVELDGNVHNLPDKKEYDKERQTDIEKYKIKFIRITNEELLGNPNKAFKRIEEKIKSIKATSP